MNDKITVCIIDDSIHQSEEFINKSVYDTKINSNDLEVLVDNFDWRGQHSLKDLTKYIIKSKPSIENKITTYGFTNPSICLDEIDNGLKPDIIIYDWEYLSESPVQSVLWLKELLSLTTAFIFVYSQVRDHIPALLNKSEFDPYADRIQLFLKGDQNFSIFTSEEFIFQYIISRISTDKILKINGNDINFNENGYLKNTNDILYLESIIGKSNLIEKLKNVNDISNELIETLLQDIKYQIYFDEDRKLLISEDSTMFMSKYQPKIKMSYLDVVKKYDLETLKNLLEIGLTKTTF